MINLLKKHIDKVFHAIAGFVIVLVFGYFTSWEVGLASAAIIGILKEVWDHFSPKGTVDFYDIVWTVIGGSCGIPILIWQHEIIAFIGSLI